MIYKLVEVLLFFRQELSKFLLAKQLINPINVLYCLLYNVNSFSPLYNLSYISRRFFENQPNEICSHLSQNTSKGRFFGPDKLQNHIKEKERRKRKSEEERKKQWFTLSFNNSYTLESGFALFFEQKIQGHISHSSRTTFSAKKSPESVFFSSSTT